MNKNKNKQNPFATLIACFNSMCFQFLRYLYQHDAELKVNQSSKLQHCSTELKVMILSLMVYTMGSPKFELVHNDGQKEIYSQT